MRSFAIEEPGSPVPALYATLVRTGVKVLLHSIYDIGALSRGVGHRHSDKGDFRGQFLSLTLQGWSFFQFGESHAAKFMPQPDVRVFIEA